VARRTASTSKESACPVLGAGPPGGGDALAPTAVFGRVLDFVPRLQTLLVGEQQIVREGNQERLGLIGLQGRGPSLLLAELVLDLVEDFLRFPAPAVEFDDHARRQVRFVGQELVDRARERILIHDPPQLVVAVPGLHLAVHEDAPVDRVSRIPHRVLGPREDHVLFDPADEIGRALPAAAVPVAEIDAGLVVDDQHAGALRCPLAQAFGFDSLEGAHVVLVQALAHGQMAQEMGRRSSE